MRDYIEILRDWAQNGFLTPEKRATLSWAVATIEKHTLRRVETECEIDRLREALETIARRGYTGASFVALEALKEKP